MRHFKFILSFLFIFCSFGASSQVIKDTITILNTDRTKPAIYKTPNGKLYKVKFVADPSTPIGVETLMCGEDEFSGTDRATAKTSFVKGAATSFNSICQLLASLTPDAVIRPKLTRKSKRIAEENKNVRLEKNIFLYAMKSESDNDYHIIIGDNKILSKATLLNIEISGVPASGNAAIQKVRDFFETNFVQLCGSKYAVFTGNPIPIKVSGSVFYDVDHPAGQVGPTGLRPKTSWEIHPIAKISMN
jgi:hypothetical protein